RDPRLLQPRRDVLQKRDVASRARRVDRHQLPEERHQLFLPARHARQSKPLPAERSGVFRPPPSRTHPALPHQPKRRFTTASNASAACTSMGCRPCSTILLPATQTSRIASRGAPKITVGSRLASLNPRSDGWWRSTVKPSAGTPVAPTSFPSARLPAAVAACSSRAASPSTFPPPASSTARC